MTAIAYLAEFNDLRRALQQAGDYAGRLMREYEGRNALVRKYAWAVPDEDALKLIAKYGPIVEGGAGTGYWAMLLKERGVDVVAYDLAPYNNDYATGCWFPVMQGGAEAMSQHKDRTLFLCWPPYDTSMALDHLRAHDGERVIYIGEGFSGCTGDDAFHEALGENYTLVDRYSVRCFRGMGDSLRVYERNKK